MSFFALLVAFSSARAQLPAAASNSAKTHAPIQAIFPIRIAVDSAFPGEVVRLPVILNDVASAMAQGATLVRVKCTYNSTILEPLTDPAVNRDIVGRIDFAVTLNASMDTVVGSIPFRVGLGNAVSTALRIDSASTNSPNALLAPTDGLLAVRGICYAGGPRLMNPSGTPSIVVPAPRVSENRLPVEIKTIEEGLTKLYLVDMLARRAKVFFDEPTEPGLRKMNLDLGGIANGKYLLVLETPTKQITQTLEVVR